MSRDIFRTWFATRVAPDVAARTPGLHLYEDYCHACLAAGGVAPLSADAWAEAIFVSERLDFTQRAGDQSTDFHCRIVYGVQAAPAAGARRVDDIFCPGDLIAYGPGAIILSDDGLTRGGFLRGRASAALAWGLTVGGIALFVLAVTHGQPLRLIGGAL
jgi:hypothetical protein